MNKMWNVYQISVVVVVEMARSRLNATSTSWVQVILLPQPPLPQPPGIIDTYYYT